MRPSKAKKGLEKGGRARENPPLFLSLSPLNRERGKGPRQWYQKSCFLSSPPLSAQRDWYPPRAAGGGVVFPLFPPVIAAAASAILGSGLSSAFWQLPSMAVPSLLLRPRFSLLFPLSRKAWKYPRKKEVQGEGGGRTRKKEAGKRGRRKGGLKGREEKQPFLADREKHRVWLNCYCKADEVKYSLILWSVYQRKFEKILSSKVTLCGNKEKGVSSFLFLLGRKGSSSSPHFPYPSHIFSPFCQPWQKRRRLLPFHLFPDFAAVFFQAQKNRFSSSSLFHCHFLASSSPPIFHHAPSSTKAPLLVE